MKSLKKYPPVVIIGLNAASLCIVRSLGRKGIRIIGLYEKGTDNYYTKSKYLSLILQRSLKDKALIDVLIDDVTKKIAEPAVLFCATDDSVLTVSQYQDQLRKNYKFVVPSYDVTNCLISKKEFYRFAVNNSIATPVTHFSNSLKEVMRIVDKISFPCIIKPEFKTRMWSDTVPSKYKVFYAESREDFLNLVHSYQIENIPLLIQEWIEGDDIELYFCLLYISQNHEPLAVCTGRKLRQHPHLAGTLSIAESVWIPEIAYESLRVLKTAGCVGLCSVEFKHSKKNGKFYVIEPTIGRADSQEGICVQAGLDIPYVSYLDAIGHNVQPLGKFQEGVKWIDEPLMYYTIQEIFQKTLTLRDMATLLKGRRSYSLMTMNDPVPFLFFLKEKFYKNLSKIRKIIAN